MTAATAAVTAPAPAPATARARPGWAALVFVVVLVLLLAQDPGRMTFDTKLGVDIDPVGFYERLWHLWNPLEYQGGLQDQYVGYAFPMGAFYLLGHLLHIPVWITERLWMSLLVTAGFWGIVRLAEALGVGAKPSRLLAGATFALWPTVTILIGSSSGALLPGLLAPWAVLPLARAARTTRDVDRQPAWRAAAQSGVAVACMGGINAVSTLAALVLPLVYILTRPGRRRRTLLLWWIPAVIGATVWWAGPLLYQGAYGFNFLPYIEQATTTTSTMSAAAALRGTGNWVAYLNLGQSWLTAGSVMTSAAWAAIAAALAVAAGLAGVARRDLPEALWIRVTLGLAALYGLAGYSGALGGPLAKPVQALLDGHGLDGTGAALRNVYKIEPVIAAVLVLGLAHLLSRPRLLGRAPRGTGRERRSVRHIGLGVAGAAVLAGLALPYLSWQVLQPGSFTSVPAYWQQAANWLASRNGRDTTFVVPADSHGIYTWGQSIDEPLEPLANSPWTQRDLVPYSGGGTADLLNAAEQAIESGQATPGLAAYLDRAGIRYVLVRNDLDPAQPGYTPPTVVHAALASSGFTRAAAFGTPVPAGPVGQGTSPQAEAVEPSYPPVEIYQAASSSERVSGPAQLLRASSTVKVSGGPGSLLQLSGQGLLSPDQPAVTAGQSSPVKAPEQLVTDGLRRADTAFGLPNDNTSYTYTAAGTIPVDDPQGAGGQPPRQLLPAGAAGHQTVEVLSGAASVTASSAGSWLWEQPQGNPAYAFDGDPGSAWTEAQQAPSAADGQWVQVNFGRTRRPGSRAAIRLLDDVSRPVATRLVVTTAAGRAVTDTSRTGAAQPLRIPPGPTSWLRITFASVSGGSAGGPGAGISDVSVPGVKVTPYLEPASSGTEFSFQRAPGTSLGLPGQSPEPSLNRAFDTSRAGRYTVQGTVAPVPGAALNALLSRLDSRSAQVHVTASSTFGSLPSLSPRNLLAGVGWVAASPHASLHLSWTGKRPVDEIDLTAMSTGIGAQPTRVIVSSPAGTADVPVPSDGVVTFPVMRTGQLTLTFPSVVSATSDNAVTGSAQQLPVGLGSLTVPALSGLNTGLPPSSRRFTLACGQGPTVTVDGHVYQTSVSGTVGDLLKLTPLPVHVCDGALTLSAGNHYLSTQGTGTALAVSGLSVTSSASSPGSAPGPASRSLRIGTWQDEYRTVTVGAGAQSYLEVHQAANPGWTAALNGKRLAPVTLDGWQQAFVVPAGAGGTVTMTFTPGGGYRDVLIGSFVAFAVVLAAACWRRYRWIPASPAADWAADEGDEPGAARDLVAVAAAAAVLALVGGWLALAVPAVAVLGRWRRDWVPWVALAAMGAAGIAVLTGLGRGPSAGDGAFGWPAQAAALIALAAALTPPLPDTVARVGEAAPVTWPLSAVEELDWYLEHPGEPSLVHLETHIRGGLDRGALERALAVALAADPASRRRLAPEAAWRRHPRWDTASGAIPELRMVTWADTDELDALRESLTTVPIPLDSRVARLTLAVGPGRDVLFLQVHHAAFDGISALALLSAIGTAYRSLAAVPACGPGEHGAGPGDGEQRIVARMPPAFPPRSRGSRVPGAVARVASGRSGPARPGYGFARWTGPVPRPAGTGDRPRPTVNDLLITALILAVHRWNSRRPGGRISVCVPVNMRAAWHRWSGPGNQSRLIRVSAAPADCDADPAALLTAVSEQTRKAREHPGPGLDGMSRLLAAGWAPAGLKRTAVRLARRLASPLATDTALVSNLGVLPSPPAFTDGSAPLWFCGPAPMPRGIGLGALTVGGRLHLTLVYSRALLDGPAAADFAALYRRTLTELAPEHLACPEHLPCPDKREEREREAS